MQRSSLLGLALALLGHVASGAVIRKRIEPPLDPKSDKKFFGPPFPADYPDDKQPSNTVPFKFSYPSLQPDSAYDKDYVRDENSDNGEWKAQMHYDKVRTETVREKKKLDEAAGAEKKYRAAEADHDERLQEAKEALDEAIARSKAAKDQVAKKKKDVEEAQEGEEEAAKRAKAVDDAELPGTDDVEAAKKKVEEQVDHLEDCKRQLERAEKRLRDVLKKQASAAKDQVAQNEAEQKAAAEKLKEARATLARAKAGLVAAEEALEQAGRKKLAEKVRLDEENAELEKVTAAHKETVDKVKKEQEDLDKVQRDLEAAEQKLFKAKGVHVPSGSPAAALPSLAALMAVLALIF